MLNCVQDGPDGACIPNGPGQKHPATAQPNHDCPVTDELPNGMATFLENVMDMVIKEKTSDGRSVVAAFSWFNEDMAGGTYNLRLFDDAGKVNALGESYLKKCQEWAGQSPPSPVPTPTPTPPTPTPTPPPTPPPTPTPTPTPSPSPSASCKVGDAVQCPGSTNMCGGNQCCPDQSTCPSAENTFTGCQLPKKEDCTTSSIIV